ncbi:hypothetical protein BBJ28_00007187 [Nothophytophthora sp. Chile5]|nr:hypothetical protein BBJ28_00007187 [Nothophytophthora sp. Chile5]
MMFVMKACRCARLDSKRASIRASALGAGAAVIGRTLIAPLVLLIAAIATGYGLNASFFITASDSYFAYSQLDPLFHGGCSGCVCSCRKVLLQLSAFGNDAVLSKPTYENLQASATDAVAAGNYSGLTSEELALADQLDKNGAVCSTGVNDWGTPNIVLAGEAQQILDVVNDLGLSLAPQMVRELEVAAENKSACISRWNLGFFCDFSASRRSKTVPTTRSSRPLILIRSHTTQTAVRTSRTTELSAPSWYMRPTEKTYWLSYLKCSSFSLTRSRKAACRSFRAMCQPVTLYGVENVTQPLLRSYFAGCRVRVVNTTGVYVEDTCQLVEHWRNYGLMLQSPDAYPVCSTGNVCVRNQYNSRLEYTDDVDTADHTRLSQIISVFRSRYADTVNLNVLPGIVVGQILLMGVIRLYQVMSHKRSVLLAQIWAYRCQNGRMQPVYLAQITYHFIYNSDMYYLGLSTGTLSTASVLNLTLSFFAFAYSFTNLVKARMGVQLLDRHFRILWELLLLAATFGVAIGLSLVRLTSLAFIGTLNGELLRLNSARGATYCGLQDLCYVFTVNLGHVYQATSVVLLLLARLLPRKLTQTFNELLIRWYMNPNDGTLSYAMSCTCSLQLSDDLEYPCQPTPPYRVPYGVLRRAVLKTRRPPFWVEFQPLQPLRATQGKSHVRELDAIDLHTHVYLPRYMDLLRARKDVPFVRAGAGGERLVILPAEQQQIEEEVARGGSDGVSISAGRPIGGEYWDATHKLRYMDRHGIRTSVLSLANPWLDFLPPDEQTRQAALLNDDMEALCQDSSGRFLAFGVVPQSSQMAVKEVQRLANDLPHVKGVILSTAGLNGKGLDDPEMLEFYQAVDQAGLTIFLHPHYGVGNEHYAHYGHALFLALGFTFETTVAVSQLVLSGLLDQVPDTLRLLLAHSGGTLPFLAGRLDSCVAHDAAIAQKLQHAPSVYLKRFYYDAVAYHEPALQCLIDFAGSDKIVFGTDHPFFPPAKGDDEEVQGESGSEVGELDLSACDWRSTLANYEIMANMSSDVQSAMLRDNAKKLLGI